MEEVRALGQPVVVADQLDDGHKRQLLNQLGVRISVLLRTKDQFVGFLMLGDKLSGDIYTEQDIDLLKILASQLAVAISNAIAYEQVSRFNETLKDRVNRATARLRVANHHLKELDNAKDEFISMASHQLRTPLTTIKGYISMLLEGDAEPLKPKQRKFAEMAFESTQRMVYVISDLLNVSRLSAGRFILDPEPTNLAQMVRDEVRLLANHAES
jgi:signal transduction histidine kinase